VTITRTPVTQTFLSVAAHTRPDHDAARKEAPHATTANPTWITIQEDGEYPIELNLEDSERLMGFAFHVRGGEKVDELMSRILRRLGLRALDADSESGLFDIRPTDPS
jgi:hypothetical protein